MTEPCGYTTFVCFIKFPLNFTLNLPVLTYCGLTELELAIEFESEFTRKLSVPEDFKAFIELLFS